MCLGRIAAYRLLAADFRVTRQHGMWRVRYGISVTSTFHPAALLRNPNQMPLAQADFAAVAARLDTIHAADEAAKNDAGGEA